MRGVQSGDCLTIQRISKADPWEEQVYLAYVSAPRIGNQTRAEDPFAFDAREFLREELIGKKVDFTIEYQIQGRKYITIPQSESVSYNLAIVKEALAKVIDKKQGNSVYDEIKAASDDCQKRKVGVWSEQPKHIEKHLRRVKYQGAPDFSHQRLLEEANQVKEPLAAILEHVFSSSHLSLYVYKLQAVVRVHMVHLYSPNANDEPELAEQGKQFISKMLLHRTVGVKLLKIDDRGDLNGRIYFPAGDIASEVLKQGLAKVSTPRDTQFDAAYFKELKNAQTIAQGKRAGVWKSFMPEESKTNLTDFTGKVVEVTSGDCLTVERDADFKLIKVFLASIKAPKITNETQENYGWESKEALRKLTIAKKVSVQIEYGKEIQTKSGDTFLMNFGSVFLTSKNNKNVAVAMLEKGLAKCSIQKDKICKYLEDLLAAEKKAMDGKHCLHSKKEAPTTLFNDLSQNSKLAKDYEAMLFKRKDTKFNAVVEYCFSGMRFKVRLEGENCLLALSLIGVKTLSADKNQPALIEYANDALSFAKDHLF